MKPRQAFTLISLFSLLVYAVFANIFRLNGYTADEIFALLPLLITPAQYVYLFWGVICIFLLMLGFYQAMPAQSDNLVLKAMGNWIGLGCLVGVLWVFFWHNGEFFIASILAILIIICLIIAYLSIQNQAASLSRMDVVCVKIPVTLSLSWFSYITLLNIATVMYQYSLDSYIFPVEAWAAILITCSALWAVFFILRFKDYFFPIVSLWIYFGILVHQQTQIIASTAAGINALFLVIVLVLARFRKTELDDAQVLTRRKLLNIVTFFTSLIITIYVLFFMTNGIPAWQVFLSNSQIAPSSFIFIAWVPFFASNLAIVLSQYLSVPQDKQYIEKINLWYFFGSASYVIWLLFWLLRAYPLSLLAVTAWAGCQVIVYRSLKNEDREPTKTERWLVHYPTSYHMGWVGFLFLLNFAVVLESVLLPLNPLAPYISSVILLTVSSVVVLGLAFTRKETVIPLLAVWGLLGIIIGHFGEHHLTIIAAFDAIALILSAGQIRFKGIPTSIEESSSQRRQILNLVAVVLVIFVNVVANFWQLNGVSTVELFVAHPTLVTPIPLTFGAWVFVYAGLLAYAIYQVMPDQRTQEYQERISYWLATSSILNMLWVYAWHQGNKVVSFFLLLLQLACLGWIYYRLEIGKRDANAIERLLVHLPISAHSAWTLIVTALSLFYFVDPLKWNNPNLPLPVFASLIIWGVAVVGIYLVLRRGELAFPVLIIWTMAGIAIQQLSTPLVFVSAIMALLTNVGVLFFFKIRKLPAI